MREQKFGPKGLISAAIIGAILATVMAPAHGQQESPGERAVEYRQGLMTVLGGNFGPVFAMATGRMPFNAAVALKFAERAAYVAAMAPDAFPANSNGVGKTKAKPNIWSDQPGFQKRMQEMIARTAALQTAARSGNLADIKSAASAVGDSCKGCHDQYRAK